MNFFELIPLTAAAINFVLTAFVLARRLNFAVKRAYVVWGASIVIWNVGTWCMFRSAAPQNAVFWARFLQFGVIFLPVSLFHLSLLIVHASRPRLIKFFYGLHTLFALCNLTPLFVSGVRYTGYAYYSKGGPVFWLYTISYAVLTSYTVAILWTRLRLQAPLHRTRVKSLLMASGVLIFFGNNDLLPILGIYEYPLTGFRVYPLGSAAAIFYGIVVGYSVLQHQLLDINVTLGKVAAFAVRLCFLFIVALLLLLILTVAVPRQFTPYAFFSALAVFMISSMIASLLFPRLFGSGDERMERMLLGDRFEYHDRIRSFIAGMQYYRDADELLNELHALLVDAVQLSSYEIILQDEKMRAFSLFRSHPDQAPTQFSGLTLNSPIFEYFHESKEDYLGMKLEYASPGGSTLEQKAREQLNEYDPEFCFPLSSGQEVFGLFLIGAKTNGEPFTRDSHHLYPWS